MKVKSTHGKTLGRGFLLAACAAAIMGTPSVKAQDFGKPGEPIELDVNQRVERPAFAISFSQRCVSLLQPAHLSHRSQLPSMMVWRLLFHNGLRSPGRSALADKS